MTVAELIGALKELPPWLEVRFVDADDYENPTDVVVEEQGLVLIKADYG